MYEQNRVPVEEISHQLASLSQDVADKKGKVREDEASSGGDGQTEGR